MTPANDTPRSHEEQLLAQLRRVAGIDSHRQPVRLGERDTDGHIVGYIDEHGLAWQSLTERIVAQRAGRLFDALKLHPDQPAGRLFDALKLHPDQPRRDRLIEEVLADLPDELIGDVARAAGEMLAMRDLAEPLEW